MKAEYITAIEKRLEWLKWTRSDSGRQHIAMAGFTAAMPIYDRVLSQGPTYYMAPQFCQLVENARATVPDDLNFEITWLQSPRGFLWIETPFEVPPIHAKLEVNRNERLIEAIGWETVPAGTKLHVFPGGIRESGVAHNNAIQFCCFKKMEPPPSGYEIEAVDVRTGQRSGRSTDGWKYHAWSYFAVEQGAPLGQRVDSFEQIADQYDPGSAYITPEYRAPAESGDPNLGIGARSRHPLHEIRWIYTAMHLMAQRLAIVAEHRTDRATRRRVEREGQPAPEYIRVVTLRRLALMGTVRPGPEEPGTVDWRWQWSVEGHWRWQYYPSENIHRKIWIEQYVKGPEDKPLKPKQITLYKAER